MRRCGRDSEPAHAGSPQGLIISLACTQTIDRIVKEGGGTVDPTRSAGAATLEKVKLRPSVPILRPGIREGSKNPVDPVGPQETPRR